MLLSATVERFNYPRPRQSLKYSTNKNHVAKTYVICLGLVVFIGPVRPLGAG